MNIDEHVESVLRFFDSDAKILSEILFIGAWARYFYQDLFSGTGEYNARFVTKDLDILLNRKRKEQKQTVDVHQKLLAAGYQAEFLPNQLIKYRRGALDLEFLLPAKGAPREKAVHIRAYNLTAQELAYLEMLWSRPVSIRYGNYEVKVPNPFDFALHKLIISFRRANPRSGEQDRRDAEEVLYVLYKRDDFEAAFRETSDRLNAKSMKAVRKGIDAFLVPGLRERLQELVAV